MLFDDRLETVLRYRGTSEAALRTQFRQLLDILGGANPRGTGPFSIPDPSLAAAAWERMDMLAKSIPHSDRAGMVREAGWRLRSPELAAHLAQCEPDVAAAALERAQFSSDDWMALIPLLPVRARGFLRLRRDLPDQVMDLLDRLGIHDRGLPQPEAETTRDEPGTDFRVPDTDKPSLAEAPPGSSTEPAQKGRSIPDPVEQGRSEISALVERIARFRRSREAAREESREAEQDMPRLPLGEEPGSEGERILTFGFAADTSGRIDWAEALVAPMVIGTRLVRTYRAARSNQSGALERALIRRQPIENAELELSGAEAISGKWLVNARPRFTDAGNFAGYVGRFRRPASAGDGPGAARHGEADRIRQLLHELRTPVTAVQGYAEVIQQQLFGSAPHEYRALAAAIAADAARILAGFEELDRLARLESGAVGLETGRSDLAELARATIAQLSHVLAARMAGIEIEQEDAMSTTLETAVSREPLEALLWRLLATLGGGCAEGEVLGASLSRHEGMARLRCEVPARLRSESDIFAAGVHPATDAINAGLFGAGFALRLARAEARGAGGNLVREQAAMTLSLPLYTAQDAPDQTISAPPA